MKKTIVLFGALALLSPQGLAQDGSAAPPTQEKASALPEGDLPTFEALHHQFVKAKVHFSEQLNKLRTSDAYQNALKKRDMKALRSLIAGISKPENQVLGKFLEAAGKMKGSKEEARFLFYVLKNPGNQSLRKKAFDALAARHFDAAGWGPILRSLPWILPKEEANSFLARLAEKSPHPEVRIMAKYVQATSTLRNKQASKEEKRAAREALEEIKTRHPDSLPGLSLNSNDFIKEHLQIGMKAPEIIGKDVYGKPMKLSDFRGRVVVIDFWGDW